jgi:hypothetical protein
MHHLRDRVSQIVPLLLVSALAAGCGGGSKAKPTQTDTDCAAVTGAARQVVLLNPKTATDDQIQRVDAAADLLTQVSTTATTAVAEPGRKLGATAKAYAAALATHDAGRATIVEATLRRDALPVADACGLALRPDQVLGTTSGPAGSSG